MERRAENGEHCFYEPECGPKCLEFDIEVGVKSLIKSKSIIDELFRNVSKYLKRRAEIFHTKTAP